MNKVFILIGATLVLIGVILTFFPNAFSWFGRLPGDIRIESKSGGFYFPLVSMIIISILLSVILSLFRR